MPFRLLMLLVALACCQGCIGPRATLSAVRAERVVEDGRLEAVSFKVSAETSGGEGEQLLYRVSVVNKDLVPVKSTDGKFELRDGQVGAQRAFLVQRPRDRFPDLKLTIPRKQMHLQETDVPAVAFVTLNTIDGICLARAACRIPLVDTDIIPPLDFPSSTPLESDQTASTIPVDDSDIFVNPPPPPPEPEPETRAEAPPKPEVSPTPVVRERPPTGRPPVREDRAPAARTLWFIETTGQRVPTLWGPFPNRSQADDSAHWFGGRLVEMTPATTVWVVPILNWDDTERDWAGPCMTLENAHALSDELAEMFLTSPELIRCGIPFTTPIQRWIDKHGARLPASR